LFFFGARSGRNIAPIQHSQSIIENLELRLMRHNINKEKSQSSGKNISNGMVEPYYIHKVIGKIALRLKNDSDFG